MPLPYKEHKTLYGGGNLAQRGRPRIYNSYREKMRAYRETKKQGGAVRIDCYLPSEYKELLEQLCAETKSSMGEGICYLLDFYFDMQEHTILDNKNSN